MKKSLSLLSLLLVILLLCACTAAPSQTGKESEEVNQSAGEVSDLSGLSDSAEPSDSPEQSDSSGPSAQESNAAQTQKPEEEKTYEEHLGALTLFALSMEYPDFSLQGTYTATAVTIANKEASDGIYVLFESMGEKFCVHVYPIAQERTEVGTLDLFAAELGFAAFDLLEEAPKTEGLTALEAQSFSQLLSDLNSVSVYGH